MSKKECDIEVCGIALISLDPGRNECETRTSARAYVFRVLQFFGDFQILRNLRSR